MGLSLFLHIKDGNPTHTICCDLKQVKKHKEHKKTNNILLCYCVFCSLFPAILNLASNAKITSNATCGETGPEMFCKLVEHVPGRTIRNPQCRICDSYSSNPKERHPITNAIDGTNNWWQSPSIKNGRQNHWVTITLDLRQVFQVAYVIIKSANSPRPGNWILERSVDGIEFQPWQFYAISDTECLTRYNVTPRLGNPTYKYDDEVICTSYYSRLVPFEHGEIHTSLINGRPGADDLSPALLEFTSARYIRLRLQRIRTLNADLMTLSYRDPKDVDPIVTRRYFYSIKDISVGGMCICYGHAQSCPWDEATKKLQCVCEHNTCGESCNECCPGYHQKPWQPGTISTGNTCEKCNCHNKTEDCYFDQSVADRNMSRNIFDQYEGGGVCINCTQNTAGINCETCIDGFYRAHKVSPYEMNPCAPCNCDPYGAEQSVCIRDDAEADLHVGLLPGQCQCKEGYDGVKCDRCSFGYSGYPHCVRCNCSLVGSTNTDPCAEECVCKNNVMGENCSLCKEGYYNLQKDNPDGCTECFCFGVSNVCETISWSRTQVFFYNLLNFHIALHTGYTLETVPSYGVKTFEFVILPESFIDWQKNTEERDKLMTVLANLSRLQAIAYSNFSSSGHLRIISVSLERASANAVNDRLALDVEFCKCPEGYTGTSCESCSSGYYRVDGILFGGICKQCECNGHASECDIHGVCFDCQDNTTGPHCEQCMPGYYGDASRGTTEDCQLCACPLETATNNFSPTCYLDNSGGVICDQCLPGYDGPRCERCADGFYGDPTVPGQSCIPCDCNGNVNPVEPGRCDTQSGECLKCINNTAGRNCEICAEGYFGDAIVDKNCQACACHVNSSYSNICDLKSGQCQCKENVTGLKCDKCVPGHFGLSSGLGCQPCKCNLTGSLTEECSDEGQCHCILGVAGEKCDRCAHGFYNFQDDGCTPCNCAHTHNTCNAETGECICPPHTIGAKCEICQEDYWDHNSLTGCKACNCSTIGSVSSQCDLLSGHCHCKPGFGGDRCDECALGFRSFPACIACNCNINGTRQEFCNEKHGICSCEEETGKCVCKENVEGDRCNQCKPGTFALSVEDPLGCRPCFCFGVSEVCKELDGLVRIPISLNPDINILRVVSQSDLSGTEEGVFHHASDTLLDANLIRHSTLTEPYYWRLPDLFQGSKLLSYGGKLKYTLAFYALEGSGIYDFEPQVLIKGGRVGKLVIYHDLPPPENRVRTPQEIDLMEHKWKYFNSVSDWAVTHSDFMSVLGNIEYILIKASFGSGLQQSRISNISMEVAVDMDELSFGREVAHYIESCHCPSGYAGLSCQECAPGYHRQRLTEINVRGPRPFIEPCVPCQCNNHSKICDLDTGKCEGCQHNTVGYHCNLCAPGYYGKVNGSINDCSLCACPHGNVNSFSPTCILERNGDFRCNACMPGYEGQYCERCSEGYYGNPKEQNGICQLCTCNPAGSVHNYCDQVTGQCICKQGVRGRLCDECEVHHILMDTECVSCDDNCTGVLLSDLDNMMETLKAVNLTAVVELANHLNDTLGSDVELTNSTQFQDEILQILQIMRNKDFTQQHQITTNEHFDSLLKTTAWSLLSWMTIFLNEHSKMYFLVIIYCIIKCLSITKVFSSVHVFFQHLEEYIDELQIWNPMLRKHVDNLVMNMSTRGVLDLVFKAEDHAAVLKKLADSLEDVRNVSVNATTAVHANLNIKNNIEEAERKAEQANSTVAVVLDLVKLCLLKFRIDFPPYCPRFKSCLQKHFHFTGNSSLFLDLKNSATGANSSVTAALQQLEGLNQQLESSSAQQMNIYLFYHYFFSSANAAEKKVKEIEMQASLLFDRLKPLKMLEDNLSKNLSEIKELINQARKQAASIKVAVSANRDCVRSYKPEITSSNYNTLILTVKTSEPDNLLFYLGSSTNADFMALETRKGKVSFLWDVGSGPVRLEYPDIQIDNDKWHSIHATRFGRTGSISVVDLKLSDKPAVKTASSPGISTVLDINNSTFVFVGGLSGQVQKPVAVKVTHFKGCMGEASLNGKNIGLWNYAQREGACRGCFITPQDDDTSFHFDGSGYSVVEKALYSTRTQLGMLFKTFSSNGLLLYLSSNGTRDFLSIELVDGKVKLTFDLGGGPLTLETDKRYNNGNWYKVAFHRNRKTGYLVVMDGSAANSTEQKQGVSPGTSSDLNRSDKDPIYIGGLPRSRPVRRPLISRSFVGCIKNLEISNSNFDLLKDSYGVRKGCVLEPIRSVSVLKNGFLELLPFPLSPESELMATFSTKNDTGVILAGITKSGNRKRRQTHLPFFAVMLIDGNVEVHVNSGEETSTKKVIIKSETGTFSDGQDHSIILHRNRRLVKVQVDEGSPSEFRLASSAESTPLLVTNVYLGGLPPGEATHLKTIRSFYGLLKILEFKEFTYAYQFGLSANSHMVMPFDETTVKRKFSIQLTLRTFASSGLVYFMAHKNQMDYATLQLLDGQLYFIYDLGKGAAVVTLPDMINDGQWHTVKTDFAKKKATIAINGKESPPVGAVGDGNSLDVEGKLYLGGLPLGYTIKKIGNVTSSIPACIRNILLNNKPLTQDRTTSGHAVGSCFSTAQEGSYFDGTGFAALVKEGYKVRSDVIISFEFRATAENGVFLGISSAKVDAVGLELVNGKVLFHVNNGAGRLTAISKNADSSLCDGKWHKLQANKSKNRISLTIDGRTVHVANPHSHSTSADTNDPIYVGGYPGNVKQNCLTIQTPFKGCMRSLQLSKGQIREVFDLSMAYERHGVFPHSCPRGTE
uniref:Laminin subunit alpha-1 n=2 Tax=Erpetoichthys calabaricus TaxID=27687 RepID=A0A8C4RZG4_ERPCA